MRNTRTVSISMNVELYARLDYVRRQKKPVPSMSSYIEYLVRRGMLEDEKREIVAHRNRRG